MEDEDTVAAGLFEVGTDGVSLIGTRCDGCGTLYFPQTLTCRNPDCDDKRVERTRLPDCGTLLSYTIQRYRPPSLFRKDDWAPYAIGLVHLGGGLEVMGILDIPAFDEIFIGMPLRVTASTLFIDEVRGSVRTYAFARENRR